MGFNRRIEVRGHRRKLAGEEKSHKAGKISKLASQVQ